MRQKGVSRSVAPVTDTKFLIYTSVCLESGLFPLTMGLSLSLARMKETTWLQNVRQTPPICVVKVADTLKTPPFPLELGFWLLTSVLSSRPGVIAVCCCC